MASLRVLTVLAVIFVSVPAFAQQDENVADVPSILVTADENIAAQDPHEETNRELYDFHTGVDSAVLEPVARGYRNTVPEWGRERVSSVLTTLGEPNQFVNSVLQGDVESSFRSFWRFVINATLGVGGLFDIASKAGLEPTDKDFGQTLGKYGWEESNYVLIPVLGPNTTRDTIGLVFDSVTNPFHYLASPFVVSKAVTGAVDKREGALDITDEINETSFDPYVTLRSVYLQNRAQAIAE